MPDRALKLQNEMERMIWASAWSASYVTEPLSMQPERAEQAAFSAVFNYRRRKGHIDAELRDTTGGE